MRSFLGEVPVLCITATADRGMRRRLINYLSMRNPHKVILSPNKDNIRFSVNRADKELNCLNWIGKMLEKEREHCPYGIIFCQTVNDIALVLSYLLTKLGENAYVDGETPIAERCLIGVYYSMTPQTLKDRVKSSFESGIGRARIVIATTSLSMGVDFVPNHPPGGRGVPDCSVSFVFSNLGLPSLQNLLYSSPGVPSSVPF